MRTAAMLGCLLLILAGALAHTVEEGATPEHEEEHGEFSIPPWAEIVAGIVTFAALAWFIKQYW